MFPAALLLAGAALVLLLAAGAASANHGGTGVQIVTDASGDALGGQAPRDWVRLGARSDAAFMHVYVKVNSPGVPPIPAGAPITYEVGWCATNLAYFVSPDWLTSGLWGGSNVYLSGSCTAQAAGGGTTAVPQPTWECNELHIRIPRVGFQSPADGTLLTNFYIVTWDGTVTTFDAGAVGSYTLGQQGQLLQAVPATPTVATTADNAVTVSFLSVDNGAQPVQRYNVYRQTNGVGAFTLVGSTTVPATQVAGTPVTFVDTSAAIAAVQTESTTPPSYAYKVSAENCQGDSAQSTASASITPLFRPNAPTLSPITTYTGASVNLAWTSGGDNPAAGTGVAGYRVYRDTTSTVTTADALVCTTTGAAACTDATVAAGTRYYYAVQALDGYASGPNRSPLSNVEDVLPPLQFEAPVAGDQALAMDEDGAPLPILLNASDLDHAPGDLVFAFQGAVPAGVGGTPPALTYAPAADFCGTVGFDFRVTDPDSLSDLGRIDIVVACVNDPPTVAGPGGAVVMDEGLPLLRTFPGWVTGTGPGGGADEAGQQVALDLAWAVLAGPPGLPDPFAVDPFLDGAGNLAFTLLDDDAYAVVELRVTPRETDSGLAGTPLVRTVEVRPVNDAPTFVLPAALVVDENSDTTGADDRLHAYPGWATGIGAGGRYEAGDGQTLTGFTAGGFGTALFEDGPLVTPDGTLVFRLAAHAVGSATGTVTLRDSGAFGAPDANERTLPYTIVVQERNTPPVAEDDAAEAITGVPLQFLPLLANDDDLDGDALAVATVDAPAGHAVLATAGGVLYTPPSGFEGDVTFTYRATDGRDASGPATVTLAVGRPVDPVAVIAMVSPVCRGVPTDIYLAAVQAGRIARDWAFDAGDGRAFTSSEDGDSIVLELVFATVGTYTARLEADLHSTTDATDVLTVSAQMPLQVHTCSAPFAAFELIQDGFEARLRDTSLDDIGVVAREWDFGDGGSSTAAAPTHVYAAPGLYRIRLLVEDGEGLVSLAERVVVVGLPGGGTASPLEAPAPERTAPAADPVAAPVNRAPVADAGEPLVVRRGALARLDASGSTDPDGDALRHQWQQLDGPPVVLVGADTARPTFTPAAPGLYVFRVRVQDGFAAASDEVRVTVVDGATAAAFEAVPSRGGFSFQGAPADATYAWDFGDGATSTARTPEHAYAEPGSYPVRLRVTTDAGVAEAVQVVTVAPAQAPPASLGDGAAGLDDADAAAAVRTASVTSGWPLAVLVALGAAVVLGTGCLVFLLRRRASI